jgi:diguanylate cyclase (GGDEF)-like protein
LNETAMPQITIERRHAGALAWSACFAVVFLAWIGLFHASRMLEYAPLASLWFPPAAVSFAAFAVLRWRALPALMLASLAGSWSTFARMDPDVGMHDILVNGVLYGAVHCIAYWFVAAAVLRSISSTSSPSMARTVATFLLGGMIAAAMAAIGGTAVTTYIGLIPLSDSWPLVLPWLIGDYTGLIAMGPLLTLALRTLAEGLKLPFGEALFAYDDLPRPQRNTRGFVMKLTLVLSVVMLSLIAISRAPDNEPLMFVIFVAVVLQLWIVHTQGLHESLISIALFSLTIVAMVYVLDLGQIALPMQFAMITLATGSYFGMSVPTLYADNAQLRRLLIHDALTGAYTRHFFVDLSQQALRQATGRGQFSSMLMIDMDYLKTINDRYGHRAGDLALTQTVRVCRQCLGDFDLLGRLGGDEFCALLPGLNQQDAAVVAERIVAAVTTARFDFASGVAPSVSIGIATTRGGDDYDSLWLRADSALYVAKRNGRGRFAQEEE